MKLRFLLLAAAVASLCIAVPSATGAPAKTYKSRVSISKAAPVFHGRVAMRNARQHPRLRRPCRTHRRVTVFSVHGGHVKTVGKTVTNPKGKWAVHTKTHRGSYFARVSRRVLPKRGRAVCGRAVSRRIVVG